VRRLLKLFDKYNMKATWFIPGHSLETFPDECAAIRDAGHEIGLHGYSHENPVAMTIGSACQNPILLNDIADIFRSTA